VVCVGGEGEVHMSLTVQGRGGDGEAGGAECGRTGNRSSTLFGGGRGGS
jgi:hypothetical protein